MRVARRISFAELHMAGLLSNLITLGGAEQIEVERNRIRARIAEGERALRSDQQSLQEGARVIREFGVRYKDMVESLRTNPLDNARPLLPGGQGMDGAAVGAPSESGRLALSAAGGLVACEAVTAAVGAFGTASTGTAIASLAGAAKTSATLAWLGGGSLAAGGGGMALGAAATVGLACLPALGIGAVLSRRSARELAREYTRIDRKLCRESQVRNEIVRPFSARAERAKRLSAEFQRITKAREVCRTQLARHERWRPTGGFSLFQLFRWIGWTLGRWSRNRLAIAISRLEGELARVIRQADDLVSELRGAYCE